MQISRIADIQISESVLCYEVAPSLPLKVASMENPLSERLRMRRDERGLTQTQIAEMLGMKSSQYNRYEKGADPSTELLARIAKILACTTDYLLGLVDKPLEYLEEREIPPDEKQLLHAYRQYKIGNRITKVEQRVLGDLTAHNPEAPLIEAPKDTRLSGDKK